MRRLKRLLVAGPFLVALACSNGEQEEPLSLSVVPTATASTVPCGDDLHPCPGVESDESQVSAEKRTAAPQREPAGVDEPIASFEPTELVDARGDAAVSGCTIDDVAFGWKTYISVTVKNSASQTRTYRVTGGVADSSGRLLDQEAEWIWAVDPGESRENTWAIRTFDQPSGCVIVDAVAG